MNSLLDQALEAVRRLDPAAQEEIAQAMLALAASEKAGKEDVSGLISTVMPSATPTQAEIMAWNLLPRDEQLRRMRLELDHPDCKRVSAASMSDIRGEGQALAAKLRDV